MADYRSIQQKKSLRKTYPYSKTTTEALQTGMLISQKRRLTSKGFFRKS